MTKDELTKKKVSAISLGCDKNRVDLEKMLFKIKEKGFEIVASPEEANIVIVNTCAFILPAKKEAIDSIIEMEFLKRKGIIEKIIVTGCFPERNFDELKENFSDVDAFLRLRDNDRITEIIENLYGAEKTKLKQGIGRVVTTPASYAFLKIADGCSNACSYCIIPRIRGRFRSTKMEQLVDEAELLVKNGAKEIILVAQDVSRYGEDLYGESKLIELCKKLVKIKGLKWLRLHYLYPENVTTELLDYMRSEEKICNYLDIPLQHIDEDILKSMRRRLNENETRDLMKKIKKDYSDFVIRTTFIVGYPGESIKANTKLCKFLTEIKFDYAGFFPYFREENTASYFMKNQVSQWRKILRVKRVKKIQEKVFNNKLKSIIGQEVEAMVDGFDSLTGYYFGHTQQLSPNTDFGLNIEGENLVVGEIVKVKIVDFDGNNFGGVKL